MNYLIAILSDLWASLRCLFYTLFTTPKVDMPRAGMENKPDVLCVHGYLHNDTPWRPFRKALQSAGAGPVNAVRYFSVVEGIGKNSLSIKRKIDEIQTKTKRDVSILIGHSQGGLVCLEYALEYAPKDRPIYVIALGSPLHGTHWANIGFGPSSKEMKKESDYLKSLHARLKEAKNIRLLALSSETDWMVSSASALAPEYAFAENDLLDNIGHVNFLFSPKVFQRVIDYLIAQKLI
jgi:pimeloyl-ACP methyl ester carboxylesterase